MVLKLLENRSFGWAVIEEVAERDPALLRPNAGF